jgi:tetratricopeptide (TPR) repeat protein
MRRQVHMRRFGWDYIVLGLMVAALVGVGCKSEELSSGILYVDQKLFEKAVGKLETAVQLEPENPEAYAYLAVAYAETGMYEKAGEAFSRAIELSEQQNNRKLLRIAVDNRDHYWAVKYNEALSYADEGNLEESEAQFEIARQLKPDDFQTLSNYGYVLSSLGKTKDAVEVYSQAMELEPDNQTVVINLAQTYQAEGDRRWDSKEYMVALGYYERALGLTPESFDALARVADSYYQMAVVDTNEAKQREFYENAVVNYQKITEIDPNNASVLFNLGLCQMGLKNADAAVEAFLSIVMQKPRDIEAHSFLGSAYYLQGSKEKATVEFSISGALENGKPRENLSAWVASPNLNKVFGNGNDMVGVASEYGVPEEILFYEESGLDVETWFYWEKQVFVSFVNGKETGRTDYSQ